MRKFVVSSLGSFFKRDKNRSRDGLPENTKRDTDPSYEDYLKRLRGTPVINEVEIPGYSTSHGKIKFK